MSRYTEATFEIEDSPEVACSYIVQAIHLLTALQENYPQGCNMFMVGPELRMFGGAIFTFSGQEAAILASRAILSFNGDSARTEDILAVLEEMREELE